MLNKTLLSKKGHTLGITKHFIASKGLCIHQIILIGHQIIKCEGKHHIYKFESNTGAMIHALSNYDNLFLVTITNFNMLLNKLYFFLDSKFLHRLFN